MLNPFLLENQEHTKQLVQINHTYKEKTQG